MTKHIQIKCLCGEKLKITLTEKPTVFTVHPCKKCRKDETMSLSMNGKRIKAIYFSEVSEVTNDNAELFMEIHGPETWVVQIENGIEVARHNARFIETIIWEVAP